VGAHHYAAGVVGTSDTVSPVASKTFSQRPRRRRFIQPWQSGPKPRRRAELGLLIFGSAIVAMLYALASLGRFSHLPPHLVPFLAIILGLSLVGHLANRWLVPNANSVVLPIAALLNGIGYVIIVRWNPDEAKFQAAWTAAGIGAYIATLLVIRRTRDLDRFRYLLLLVAAFLLLSPLIPHFGERIYGARLWVHFGSLTFQPVEVGKLMLCIFFASYFAENKELLTIPTARLGDRLVVDPRPLIPILLAWAFAMLVVGVENDIGFALLIFTLFIALLWLATGRVGYLVLGLGLFAGGTYLASHLFVQFNVRILVWLNPWAHPVSGFQLSQAWYALGSGGVGGTGLGLDHLSGRIPEITSDMIFAAVGNEMGLLGASVVVFAFILLVGAGLNIAQSARTDFARLMAAGLTIILGFQAFYIMAGVVRLLPLTGITLPFMAYGGSSLVANYVLIALLLRISHEGSPTPEERAAGVVQPGERSFVAARN
jgi:cell division protein FtsW (lipid II flippase)